MQLILDHDLEALTIGLVEGYACVRACVRVCVRVCEITKHSTIYFLKISKRSPKITLVQKRAFTVSELGKKKLVGSKISVLLYHIS
jgi:hypothetical protein